MFCKNCGTQILDDQSVCPECGTPTNVSQTPAQHVFPSPEISQPENVALGILGALLAAVAGAAAIALFTKMGYISSVGGLLLAFLTVFLYKKFSGGQIGTAGVLVCIALCIVAPYVGYRAGFAWEIGAYNDPYVTLFLNYLEIPHSFAGVFANFHKIVDALEMGGDVGKDLILLYLFTALGAFASFMDTFKKRKKAKEESAE